MLEDEVQDIDTELDWRMAELKCINRQCTERADETIMKKFINSVGGYSLNGHTSPSFRKMRLRCISHVECSAGQSDDGRKVA